MMMKTLISPLIPVPLIGAAAEQKDAAPGFDEKAAERFAKLALACVEKEYPNKISHVLNSDEDVAPPRKLTPAFYGCYDWHSSVHGHWLLVRLLRTFPDAPFAAAARDAIGSSLTAENLKQEAAYIRGKGRASFERPYGLAWLLQLCAELREWDDTQSIGCLPDLFATTKTVRDDKRVFGGRSHKIKPHRIAADETGQKHFEEQTDHHDGESAQPAQHDSLNAQQHLPAHGRERFDCAIAKPTRCHPASVGLPQGVCDLYSLLRVVKYIPETGCAHEQLKQHDAEAFHN